MRKQRAAGRARGREDDGEDGVDAEAERVGYEAEVSSIRSALPQRRSRA